MTNKWEDMLKGLVGNIGNAGVSSLAAAIDNLEEEAKEPWKKAILELTGDAIEKYGLDGVEKIQDLVNKIGKGEEPDLHFASLRARSDYLVVLQNMEDAHRTEVKVFLRKVGKCLGIVINSIISGLTS